MNTLNLKQIIQEEVRRQLIKESLGTWKAAGVPDELSKYILRNYKFNQNEPFETVTDIPKSSEFNRGNIIVNILGTDRAIAVAKMGGWNGFVRFELSGGTVDVQFETSLKDATRGMSRKGKFLKSMNVNVLYGSAGRGAKPSPQDIAMKSTSDPLAGSIDMIYTYMNKTFMPGLRPKLEALIDNIYVNLRKLSNTRTYNLSRSDRESALEYVGAIESIANKGFNTDTMKKFLDSLNQPELKAAQGAYEIPLNAQKLEKALTTVPNARAKWAKTVLDTAKNYNQYVMDMLNK